MSRSRTPGLVIGWLPYSQRSSTLAERLGYELALLGRPGFRRPLSAPFTYPWLAFLSIRTLLHCRPASVIIVAPPFVAALVILPIARLLSATVAIDIHSGALLDKRWRWSVPLLITLCRRADVSLVTLDTLRHRLTADGLRVMVLPDLLPDLTQEPQEPTRRPPGHQPTVVAICGWGNDEPLEELVAAPHGQSWRLLITGQRRRNLPAPPNVLFTGFLSTGEYAALLRSADAIVVLTTREDTLVSGAWEAIAAQRPLILSGTKSLRRTFGDAATYVLPEAASIATGIAETLAESGLAQQRIRHAARSFSKRDAENLTALRTVLGA